MRKINRAWPKSNQFWRWSRYISNAKFQAILFMLSWGNAWKPQIWPISLSQSDAKRRKINRPRSVLKVVTIHQHTKFQGIPSMHSPRNAWEPIQTDGRTDRQAENGHGWMDQLTHVQVERGYFRLQTDRLMDGQTENLMPLAPKGRGIKMTDLFGGPKLPWNWTVEADIQHTYKSSSNWYLKQDWCETSGNFLENYQRQEFWPILGPKVAQKSDLWGPYSPHPSKYLQCTCETIPMWNQWTFLRKWRKKRILTYLGRKNGHKIGTLGPIFHTLEFLQWACEALLVWNQWKRFENVTKDQYFNLFWDP